MDNTTEIIIPKDKTTITASDYSSIKDTLKKVSFEENSKLEEIGEGSFSQFKTLEYFSLSNCNSIREIPVKCFYYCTSLKTVILPENGVLETLRGHSFACTAIKTLKLPPSVKNILCITQTKDGAFVHASKFEKFEFYSTNGIEVVDEYIFIGTKLVEFDVGPSLKTINGVTFEHVTSSFVRFIASGGENEKFCVEDKILYSNDKTALICCPHGYVPNSICTSVIRIKGEAFLIRKLNILISFRMDYPLLKDIVLHVLASNRSFSRHR